MNRRRFLQRTNAAAFTLAAPMLAVRGRRSSLKPQIRVHGQTTDPRVAFEVFPGGNAVDSAVATAPLATVKAPGQTGVGGYGLSAIVALDGGRQVIAVDANSAAPQSMTSDIFKPGPDGTVGGRINDVGWLSAGVPGALAGFPGKKHRQSPYLSL